MDTTDDVDTGRDRRCRVAGVHDYSVLLDPGSGRARFLLPRRLVPEDAEVGDRVDVSTRHVAHGSAADGDASEGPAREEAVERAADAVRAGADADDGVGKIFDEAREALESLQSGWQRPGMPSDASAASA